MRKIDIHESCFLCPQLQVRVEPFDRFAIGRSICRVNVSVSLRARSRSGKLQSNFGRACDGVIKACQRSGRGYIYVVQTYFRGVGTVSGELSLVQRSVEFEIRAGVTAPQGSAAQ